MERDVAQEWLWPMSCSMPAYGKCWWLSFLMTGRLLNPRVRGFAATFESEPCVSGAEPIARSSASIPEPFLVLDSVSLSK